jgi:hypothetical protein
MDYLVHKIANQRQDDLRTAARRDHRARRFARKNRRLDRP